MTDTNTSLININQTHGKYDIYRYVTKYPITKHKQIYRQIRHRLIHTAICQKINVIFIVTFKINSSRNFPADKEIRKKRGGRNVKGIGYTRERQEMEGDV